MPKHMLVTGVAMLSLLAACGAKNEKPVKREPGSWSTKITIGKLEGKGVTPQTKVGLQQMFDAMSAMSVCITPEAAAREDIGHNIEGAAGAGRNCQFDKRVVSGESIEFSGTCGDGARKVRMSARGTTGATAQDMTVTVEPLGTTGVSEGVMEMHMAASRTGACKPGDITPPATPAAPAAPAGGTQ